MLNRSAKAVELPYRLRARREAPKTDKLFGRYDDLVRLLVGFVLSGVVGTYLAHAYTQRQAAITSATQLFSDHSKAMGERYFAMQQLTAAMDKRDPTYKVSDAEISARWEKYRSVLLTWNSGRNFNREMVEIYFGPAIWNAERDIHYRFRAWGEALEAERTGKGTVDFACLALEIDKLLVMANGLNKAMAHAIREDQVFLKFDKPSRTSTRLKPFCLTTKAGPGASTSQTDVPQGLP
jgi:hypothetical protein